MLKEYIFPDISGHSWANSYSFYYANNITTFVKSLLCSHCENSEVITDEMPFYEAVNANSKVSQKQDIFYDLPVCVLRTGRQDKIIQSILLILSEK